MSEANHTRSTGTAPFKQTGQLLIEHGIIHQDQLDKAIQFQKDHAPNTMIGMVVVQLGFASDRDVTRALAQQAGCPFAIVTAQHASPSALRILPSAFLERHNLLPLNADDGWLTIALEAFNDPFLLDEIARRSGLQVQAIAAASDDIRKARHAIKIEDTPRVSTHHSGTNQSLDSILGQISLDDLQVVEEFVDEDSNLEATAAESPIVKLVNYIIQQGVVNLASDIHIEPDESVFRIRYRVDGDLVVGVTPPRRLLPAVVSRIKILSGMDISERRLPQDGAVTIQIENRAVDLRISTMTTRHGEKVVMRIIDREAKVPTLDSLGIEEPMLSTLRTISRMPNGLMLVTGPTGSGKSTTLYSVLNEVTNDRRNTSTIEDPVERRMSGINQFQIQSKAGFTFSSALRSLLRQDPDVIMLGEIRDSETALLAVEASLTGHLVLSTLHTNDAESAIPRLVNMGVERYMIAATLKGVLAQRLVRRVCKGCRKIVGIDQAQRQILSAVCGGECPIESASSGAGCSRCHQRGSIGRLGVYDLLVVDENMVSSILDPHGLDAHARTKQTTSPPGLLADGLRKVERGDIGLDSLIQLISHIEAPKDGVVYTQAA